MPVSSLDAHLIDLLSGLVEALPEVSTRRMFGSQAWFALGRIFTLVWDGRVAVRLPDTARFEALLALDGAERWSPVPSRPMSHWLLVPEEFHDDVEELGGWVELAHRLALSAPPAAMGKKKASSTRRSAKAPAAAKGKKAPARPKRAPGARKAR